MFGMYAESIQADGLLQINKHSPTVTVLVQASGYFNHFSP